MTSRGMALIYNGGLVQSGNGFLDNLKMANAFAKKHKLVTKLGDVASAVGATGFLDSKTGGLFSKGVKAGKQAGYGRRTVTRTRTVTRQAGGRKRKARKPRK